MYKKNSDGLIKHLDFVILDIICLCVSFYLAYILRHRRFDMFTNRLYISYTIIIVILDVLFAVTLRNYKGIMHRGYWIEFKKIVIHISSILLGLIFVSFLQKDTGELSRITIMSFYIISILIMYIERIIRKGMVIRKLSKKPPREVLLVSDIHNIEGIVERIKNRDVYDFIVKGIVLIGETSLQNVGDIPVIAHDKAGTFKYIEDNVVDEIVFSGLEKNETVKKFIEECEITGMTVHIVIDEISDMIGETTVENMAGIPVISSSIKLVSSSDLLLKRLMDIIGSIVGLLITAISFVFVAPAILVSDPGPIFFSQERVGQNGRKFKIYKYRSMYKDAEKRKKDLMDKNEMQGLMFKMENDPRIIGSGKDGTRHGIGWFIRTFSIDELPQFWNILRGDMSLVGTRPPTVDEWDQYDIYHRIRMRVKPGLTGLWQVSGRSDITDFEEVVRLDSEYIRSWSIVGDIKIIFQTVKVVLMRKGSK